MKSLFLGIPCHKGILTSVIMGDIILQSSWGSNPLAKPEFNNRYANNLNLLEAGVYWKGKSHELDGKKYRAYKCWRDFGIDLSDNYTFSRTYDLVLLSPREEDQVHALSLCKPDYKKYRKSLTSTISTYYLSEFNL